MTSSLLDRPRLRKHSLPRRVTVEGAAVAAIAWALWHLVGRYGGVDVSTAVIGLAPLGAALPAAASGLRAIGRSAGVAIAAFSGGILASVAMAAYRSDMVAPLLTYAAMLVAGLATVAIVRTSWGPATIATVTLLAGARAWWVGFEVWYGSSLNPSGSDRWMALPWHNQSGILMAATALGFGVWFITARRRWAVVAGALAAAAAAATVLSYSRGSVVALAIGAAAAMAAVPRAWWRWAGVAGGAMVLTLVLTSLPGAAALQAGESLPATESSRARVDHWAAAVAMFADDPLTGQGVGAYRLASPRWASGKTNPTSHAHNEFLELAAEGGVLVAVPGAVLLLGLLVAAVRVLVVGRDRPSPFRLGAAVVWLGLAAHALIDFDWLFPVLAVAFAVASGALAGDSRTPARSGRWAIWVVAPLFVAAVALGYVEGFEQRAGEVHPPWNAGAASTLAQDAIAVGDHERAEAIATAAQRWNPADPRPGLWRAVANIGRDGPRPVVVAAERATPGFAVRLDAAMALIDAGALAEAGDLVSGVIGDFDAYPGWNLGGAAAVAYRLSVDIAGQTSGCVAAETAAAEALATPLATSFGAEDYAARAARYCD